MTASREYTALRIVVQNTHTRTPNNDDKMRKKKENVYLRQTSSTGAVRLSPPSFAPPPRDVSHSLFLFLSCERYQGVAEFILDKKSFFFCIYEACQALLGACKLEKPFKPH